jgi:hypothetical protein
MDVAVKIPFGCIFFGRDFEKCAAGLNLTNER